jgi:hypothetical protein
MPFHAAWRNAVFDASDEDGVDPVGARFVAGRVDIGEMWVGAADLGE